MKRNELTTTWASVLLVVFALAGLGGNVWAKSGTSNFEMISDVICGIGGGAQSTNHTIKVSAGAQSSPVGFQSKDSLWCWGGWLHASHRGAELGDINDDEVVNVGDLVFLVNYLYRGGPAPVPLWVGDVNRDGTIDIADIVCLANHLYRGGPLPCGAASGCGMFASASRLNGSTGHALISLSLKGDPAKENALGLAKASPGDLDEVTEISVSGKFDRIVAGVQLEIEFDPDEVELLDPQLTPLTTNLQLFTGTKDGTQKIGIVDLSGENHLPPGEGALVSLRAKGNDLGSIKVAKAVLVDRDAIPLALELSGELNLEMAKGDASIPQRFSLSQNYPNPFNPETQISYALPERVHVGLTIYNVRGQRVRVLVDEIQTAGRNTVVWDGRNEDGDPVASGIYFYRLEAVDFTDAKSMVLLK